VKALAGTEPVLVGGLNVTFTVSTSSPASNVPFPFESWNTWIVADANATSVMVSVQLGFRAAGSARDRTRRMWLSFSPSLA
jgi:hypothetical protein